MSAPRAVLIDPGHGGPESNGCLVGDVREDDYVLGVWREMVSLHMGAEGLPVALMATRTDDRALTLAERGDLGKARGADLVISVHVDASPNSHERGCFALFLPHDLTAREVARRIIEAMPGELTRGPRQPFEAKSDQKHWTHRAYQVLREHDAPAIVLECGRASNQADLAYLTRPQTPHEIAKAIYSGVAFWLRMCGRMCLDEKSDARRATETGDDAKRG